MEFEDFLIHTLGVQLADIFVLANADVRAIVPGEAVSDFAVGMTSVMVRCLVDDASVMSNVIGSAQAGYSGPQDGRLLHSVSSLVAGISGTDLRYNNGLKESIDEGSHGGARSEDDQASQQEKANDDWQKPEFLSLFHETPQFPEKFAHRILLSF
jgi:hypothetical protein